MLVMADSHESIYEYVVGLERLLHVDFHCDQRGLAVDLPNQVISPIYLDGRIDCGNWLSWALLYGKIEDFAWLYSVPGGPMDDQPGTTVIYYTYKTGVTSLDPIVYRGRQLRRYIVANEFLYEEKIRHLWHTNVSLDWDWVACTMFPEEAVANRMYRLQSLIYDLKFRQIFYTSSRGGWCHETEGVEKLRAEFENWLRVYDEKFGT